MTTRERWEYHQAIADALRAERMAEAKAKCEKRKGWLPKPPAPFTWGVCMPTYRHYAVQLYHPGQNQLTEFKIHASHGRWRWYWTGRYVIKHFDELKHHCETADEFVARMQQTLQ